VTRLFRISLVLTCNPEKEEEFDPETKRYCEKFDNCDQCLEDSLKLIENLIGPEFKVQKIKIEEIIDLRES